MRKAALCSAPNATWPQHTGRLVRNEIATTCTFGDLISGAPFGSVTASTDHVAMFCQPICWAMSKCAWEISNVNSSSHHACLRPEDSRVQAPPSEGRVFNRYAHGIFLFHIKATAWHPSQSSLNQRQPSTYPLVRRLRSSTSNIRSAMGMPWPVNSVCQSGNWECTWWVRTSSAEQQHQKLLAGQRMDCARDRLHHLTTACVGMQVWLVRAMGVQLTRQSICW